MGKNHVFIIARDSNTRLRVPCCVRKYGAKKEYGAENVYPTREACASAIIQDEVFEYTQRDGQKVLVTLAHIRKHCKCLGSDECAKDEFDIAFQRSGLVRNDFTRVLDMGDVLVSNFNMFFWICDCGTNELWVREEDCRFIKKIDAIHSIGPVFDPEKLDNLIIGADFATGEDTTNFSLFKKHNDGTFELLPPGEFPVDSPKINKLFPMHFAHIGDADASRYPFKVSDEAWQQFQKEYLNAPVAHNDVACQALAEYDRLATARDIAMFEQIPGPNGELINGRRLNTPSIPLVSMYSIAQQYGTTVKEMKEHWRCHKQQGQ